MPAMRRGPISMSVRQSSNEMQLLQSKGRFDAGRLQIGIYGEFLQM